MFVSEEQDLLIVLPLKDSLIGAVLSSSTPQLIATGTRSCQRIHGEYGENGQEVPFKDVIRSAKIFNLILDSGKWAKLKFLSAIQRLYFSPSSSSSSSDSLQLFHLEELVERKDYDCACKIQKAWKKWQLAKHALEQRARVADVFRGNKERQRQSINRQFVGDYMNYDCNYALQQLIQQHSSTCCLLFGILWCSISDQEGVVFSDQVVKLNRRNKPERRDFIITNAAFYIVARAQQNGQVFYKLTRRTALADIASLSLSTLADNFVVMHIPREYDNLVENDKKSEIVAILLEYYEALTGRKLPVQFSDRYRRH